MTETEPVGEIWEHVDRMEADRPTGETAGEMVAFHSQDLLLSVGKTYYPNVDEFIEETKQHGVSKAISVTSGNAPPAVNPGRTRLFLIHPNAVTVDREIETTVGEMNEDDEILDVDVEASRVEDRLVDIDDDVGVTIKRTLTVPGIFGYTYLSRVVYTEDTDGNVPAYIQEYETLGDLDVVKTGREVPFSEQGDSLELDNEFPEIAIRSALFDSVQNPEHQLALEAPSIENMERAPLGELVERDTVLGMEPPADEDYYRTGEGALATVNLDDEFYKILPSNNIALNDETREATTHLGPYKVVVSSPVGGESRLIDVFNTR
ncbi:hypothetical protein [Halonotius roseus]|uniref:Uncharacterized protein n=1 Tax=Halonotius roseus TaxID=2511997 RepID=A0A544QR18_9EURY|nr:hypothetical protein [Halonotius roseus]TQQ81884.1 hypothetical protein EWF95_02800 [Halonotius roseus]